MGMGAGVSGIKRLFSTEVIASVQDEVSKVKRCCALSAIE